MGKVTKEQFVNRFKAFASLDVASLPKIEPGKNTFMPWLSFKDLTEQDLGAIYDYLKFRVRPIENHVDLAGVYQEPPPKTSEATPPARL